MTRSRTEGGNADLLAGGGEMGERMRAFDWSRTPVGAPEGWPQSLKTVVRLMLHSRYPMFVWWGPEFTHFYNDGYAPILGQRHPDALGRSAPSVWSEIWDTVGPQAEAVVKEGRSNWYEETPLFMERNGFLEEVYFTYSYSPVADDEGGIGGVFCACTEDTQRVLGRRRLRTLRALAELAAEAKTAEGACEVAAATLAEDPNDLPFALLYLLDETGSVVLAGASGLPPGTSASPATIDLGDSAAWWPFQEVAATGAAVTVTELSRKFGPLPGGSWPEPPERAVVLPMKKPGQAQLAGFVVAGISPRLALGDDYRGFLDLLAGHIATAVASARAYEEERKRAEALAELDRAKTAFFSNVSHEFRTPLALMLGPVEDLLARSHTDLSPAATSQLEIVNRNGLRLLRLVNTLLDFSRIEAGRVRAVYQPTDLPAFTADLASVFRAAVEKAGLALVVDCPPLHEPVFVDRDMWEKIVLNLLSNAFKFTFEGQIAVTLRSDGACVTLRVQDTGTGIPAEEMPRVFERFHRIQDARGRTHEGSGIGLALVQELVKQHAGSIAAESAVGVGTTFTVTLPLGTAHLPPDQIGEGAGTRASGAGASPFVEEALRWLPDEPGAADRVSEVPARYEPLPVPAIPPPEEGDERPRVLLADDNADMRQYLARLLAERYAVEAVADGAAALQAVRRRTPDLVLTDVMMPALDGFGLLRELRADPVTRAIPVIMLSARAGEESRVEGMEAGADDYLIKPFSAREMLARVGAHLQMARLRREAGEALRESEARFRHMADHAPFMVWVTEADGACSYLSASWYEFTGQTPETGLGFGWIDAVHPDDQARARQAFLAANEDRAPFRVEYRLRRRDGQYRWAIDAAVPRLAADGTMLGYIGSVIDITDRRRNEEALRDADRRKDEFLAMLAHELRGPLAPLGNLLEVMKRADGDPDQVRQLRGTMERQVSQLVRLVDDLLDVSRITTNRLELRRERTSLASILQPAVESCRPLAEGLEHQLTVVLPREPIELNADPVRLSQVFSNLINNACKYTPRGGRIRVSAERLGAEVVVTVQDTGLGIPRHELANVFEMFIQVDRSLERTQGGLGIGLTLVKRLVEMHEGAVHASSEGPGRGSAFVVRLPILTAPSTLPAPAPSPRAEQAPAARRVLVVDDNADSAESMAALLALNGHETQTAHDGLEAVAAAERFRPHMVLLDIGLPRLNGFDAARQIRAQPWGRDMLLVALTGWGQDEDRRKSREAGFDVHLVKPAKPEALRNLLASAPPPSREPAKADRED